MCRSVGCGVSTLTLSHFLYCCTYFMSPFPLLHTFHSLPFLRLSSLLLPVSSPLLPLSSLSSPLLPSLPLSSPLPLSFLLFPSLPLSFPLFPSPSPLPLSLFTYSCHGYGIIILCKLKITFFVDTLNTIMTYR